MITRIKYIKVIKDFPGQPAPTGHSFNDIEDIKKWFPEAQKNPEYLVIEYKTRVDEWPSGAVFDRPAEYGGGYYYCVEFNGKEFFVNDCYNSSNEDDFDDFGGMEHICIAWGRKCLFKDEGKAEAYAKRLNNHLKIEIEIERENRVSEIAGDSNFDSYIAQDVKEGFYMAATNKEYKIQGVNYMSRRAAQLVLSSRFTKEERDDWFDIRF